VGRTAREGKDVCAALAKIYPELPRISIDYAVMEKAPCVLMVELTCQWLDVGSWPALEDVVKTDDDGNAVVARKALVVDSSNNVVFSDSDHILAVMGMEDCIIVHTADATLVCSKSDSQRLKEMVGLIGERFGPEYT
jgi:mannose-1-phosphate guanylyltransferase